MNLLRNLSIRNKLIIISLIPLLALLYYLQTNILQELKNKHSAKQVLNEVVEIQAISKLIHEFQKERSLTFSFLAANGTTGQDLLNEQRENTEDAVISLEKTLQSQRKSFENYAELDSLSLVRNKVNSLKPVSEIDVFYGGFKSHLLDVVSDILRSSENAALKNYFDQHLFLLYAKDFLAQIRSELGGVFTSEKFEGTAYGSFASLKGKHEINLQRFKKTATAEVKDLFDRKYQGPFVQQTYNIIDSAYNDPSLAGFKHDFATWWATATSAINSLKELEDYSGEVIRQKAEHELSVANAKVTINAIVAALIILVIIVIVTATVKGVVSSINRLKEAAERMAKGDVSRELKVKTKDELGELAVSFNKMITVTKSFADVAGSIGRGDYSAEIKVRSDEDLLGKSLDKMKNDLQKLSRENEIRTWLLTGSSQLNDKMRGEKEVKELAQDVINYLTAYMKAQIGAIYLKDNGQLDLTGSYAFHHRKHNANSLKNGQGLVGQAALEKKPILFNEVPQDYIRINSGLGNSSPKSIIVFPFLYEDEVKGVMEIGAAHDFSELDMEFLNLVAENIGIAFNAAQSRSKLKELLEETQRQAEELEAQQEELKQSNEELHEKTEMLERSEAELKTQQEELQQTNEELEEKANLLEVQKDKLEVAKMDIETNARELEATSRYKSEFLANMSHELRTPLNSILILSQLLSENKSKSLGEKEVDFAKNIYNSGADLLNLINEILDLSKVESGRIELDISEVSFEEIDNEMTSMFSEVAKSKSIEFSIHHNEKELKYLATDKQRLEQILRNLLSNAFKFTPKEGKVTLTIEKAPVGVTFKNAKLYHGPSILALSVTDTGIGIANEKLGLVFEAFQQADGSTKRQYGGTGLGLSISRELANALGGEIHVESTQGKGSKFTLYLPAQFNSALISPVERKVEIKERKDEPPPKAVLLEKFPAAKGEISDDRYTIHENDKVILIMEDDPEFSRVLLEFVRERNYKGIVAAQGNTGLSYARHYKPDAILLDMGLPVMDGTEVLKHLKNDPDMRHVPVQIVSGYDKRKESMELGAFDFIRKPVTKEDLEHAFNKIVEFVSRKLKKLLVVEDNNLQNKAIRELIGNGDVKSFSAFSGGEAYEMLSKESYDCVIVDLGLPDMSGFDLLEKIKANDQLRKIPIIVYTGRDLSKEENTRLMKFADTVVLKTADSQERLLDETMLFLHRVESKLPKEKQNIIRKLHKTEDVLKNKKVLVVDDDIRNIYSLTNALEEEGMHCITAENGKVALKKIKENNGVEIVLMDVMMPEMDGYEATKEIRSIGKFSKLPIIALTAKAMKGDREKCLAAGMSDYISKPVNIEQLLSLLRVWLYR